MSPACLHALQRFARKLLDDNDQVAGEDRYAATTDRLIPGNKCQTGNRGRSGCTRAPDRQAGAENAFQVTDDAIGNQSGDISLLHAGTQDVAGRAA